MFSGVKALFGGLSLLHKLAAVAAIVAALWGAVELYGYSQRQRGAAGLQNKIDRANLDNLKKTMRQNDELRKMDTDDLVDELVGGVQ